MRHPTPAASSRTTCCLFKLVAEMVLSPDGRWISVDVLEEIDAETDTYVSNL